MKSKQLPTKKSDLLKILTNNYPNFYKKDLSKLLDIFVFEIKNSLKRKEELNLEMSFLWSQNYEKLNMQGIQKQMKKFLSKKNIVLILNHLNIGLKK